MNVKVGLALRDAIELAYDANLPVLLIGETGVGKSESLAQTAEAMGVDFIVRDLSIMEAPDLVGIPVVEDGRTVYAPPSFLPEDGCGLICFEELNRAPQQMQAPCLQLLTARKLNDYELPSGWLPVAAVNPDDSEYLVEELDRALLARFVVIEVEPDVKAWLEWAKDNDVHPAVMRYVRSTRDIFGVPRSNPRAWKYVSDLLQAHEGNGSGGHALLANIAGLIGNELAFAFERTYQRGTAELPKGEEVVGAYSRVGRQVRKWSKEGNTAALNALLHEVQLFLQDPTNEERVREGERLKENLLKFLKDIPADFAKQITGVHGWLRRGRKKR